METEYKEFALVLGNGDSCTVRYCDEWGAMLFGTRTVHFEFLGSLTISPPKYRSEFRTVGEDVKIEPVEMAKQIIGSLTGIPFDGESAQLKLI